MKRVISLLGGERVQEIGWDGPRWSTWTPPSMGRHHGWSIYITNFWSIVVDDHWSRTIYWPEIIVWSDAIIHHEMILFIVLRMNSLCTQDDYFLCSGWFFFVSRMMISPLRSLVNQLGQGSRSRCSTHNSELWWANFFEILHVLVCNGNILVANMGHQKYLGSNVSKRHHKCVRNFLREELKKKKIGV